MNVNKLFDIITLPSLSGGVSFKRSKSKLPHLSHTVNYPMSMQGTPLDSATRYQPIQNQPTPAALRITKAPVAAGGAGRHETKSA
jgi:hypothetical protein